MPPLSVIICTNNPRPAYFVQVLEALRQQSLDQQQWELVIIDNASSPPVAGNWDLSWHACARQIRDDRVGLTNARLRGISESSGEALVFVDDDNVLAPDYLEQCTKIRERMPCLGAYGAARIEPAFERQPPAKLARFVPLLAVRNSGVDRWSNDPLDSNCTPYGAGLVVKRDVAEKYLREVSRCAVRRNLDRTADSLLSGGDLDFSFVACEMSYGIGIFQVLRLTHLIPETRLTIRYLTKLMYGHQYSRTLLIASHNLPVIVDATMRYGILFYPAIWLFRDAPGRSILKASRRGIFAALRDLRRTGRSPKMIVKRG